MTTTTVFIWLIFGGITAAIYNHKNLKVWEGFLLGVLLGPIGLIIGLCSKRGLPQAPAGMRAVKCPRCNTVQNVVVGAPSYVCWQCQAETGLPVGVQR